LNPSAVSMLEDAPPAGPIDETAVDENDVSNFGHG
jgi:hypothetical protein